MLDTGSDDGTPEIARQAGCRVVERPGAFDSVLTPSQALEICRRFERDKRAGLVRSGQSLFHFGRARQALNDLATHDYVLQVDGSDEFLSLNLDTVSQLLNELAPARFFYSLRVQDVRLAVSRFADRRICHWEGRAHETLVPQFSGHLLEQGVLSLRHHRNESKLREHYLPSLALEVLEENARVRWLHYLGREMIYCKRYLSSLPLLRRHADSPQANASERCESLCLMATSLTALGRVQEAVDHYQEAFRLDSSRRQPLLRLADLCLQRSDFQGAVDFANAALKVPDGNLYMESEYNYGCGPHAVLYWALFWLGRRQEAREHWRICRTLAPADARFAADAALFGEAINA